MSDPDRYGPNSASVLRLLAAARRLTEEQAEAMIAEHQALFAGIAPTHVEVIRAIVESAFESERQDQMKLAEGDARDAVTVLSGSARGELVAGIVGRIAEALVVAELLPVGYLARFLAPWNAAVPEEAF